MKALRLTALAALAASAPVAAQFVTEPVPANTPLGSGPFKAIMEADPRLPTHTLYRPADLTTVEGKMPIVVWGNGACRAEGNRYHWLLTEISSHGYLVLALGTIGPAEVSIWRGTPAEPIVGPGPGQAPAEVTAAPGSGQPAAAPPPIRRFAPPTSTAQMIEAIDWAVAENSRAGGRFFGRLDAKKVAVMGTSCGGAQAIEAAADPRVTTTIAWNSGLFPEPVMIGGKQLTKDDLKLIHGPIAYISGDERDIAFANSSDDFEKLGHVPVVWAYRKETGHEGTFGEAGGGDFGRAGVAWLDWQLKGSTAGAEMFRGPQCGLCVDPQWVVRQKNLR